MPADCLAFTLPLRTLPLLLAAMLLAVPTAQERTGQTALLSLDPSRRITQYGHDVWQHPQGLPQNAVTALAQTPDGYLWLGTEEGVVRFDGLRFTVFDRAATDAIVSNDISALHVDPTGVLWIGTRGGGLVSMQDGRFRRIAPESGAPGDVILALGSDRDGRLLVGSTSGLYTHQNDRFVGISLGQASGTPSVTAIAEGPDGTLWVGTSAGVVRVRDGQTDWITTSEGLQSNDVRAVIVGNDNIAWIGTRNGLQSLAGGTWRTWTTSDGLGADLVVKLLRDRRGTLWIGTRGGGLARLRDGVIDRFDTSDGLSHEDVVALFEDAEGSLWIGTNNGGLNRLRRSPLVALTAREGLSEDIVLPIAVAGDGTTWVGTYGGGLNATDGNGVTRIVRERDGLSSDIVLSLWPARDGTIWVGTRSGLDRVVNGRIDPVSRRLKAPIAAVHAIFEDRTGTVWIGTRRGLFQYDGRRFTAAGPSGADGELFVSAILESPDGALWIGTQGTGVHRLVHDSWSTYDTAAGLPSAVVWSLNVDARGQVWAGTSGGVARFDGTRFSAYTTDDGLPAGSIFQVLDDERGGLWMSSNRGIFRIARQQIDALDADQLPRLTPRWFDEADGMKSRECNGGFQPAGWKRGSQLLFPTLRGMVTVDPSAIDSGPPPPPPIIERVSANGQEFDPRTRVSVPPGTGALEFRYTSPSLFAPSKLRFRYRLDGFEADWVDAEDRRTATYTNIPPGNYQFLVAAANQGMAWGPPSQAVQLHLQPHFHQTAAFYLLLIGVGFVVVVGAHRWRVRALRARARRLAEEAEQRSRMLAELQAATEQRERALQLEQQARAAAESADRLKDEFLATLSHELRTPVNAILGWTQILQRNATDPQLLARALSIIHRNAAAQARLVEDILDMSAIATGTLRVRPQHVQITKLLHETLESMRPAAEAKHLTLNSTLEADLPLVHADPQRLQQIVANLLMNAIKFTEAGVVTLRARTDGTNVIIEVADTGPGISPDLLPHVFDPFRQGDSSATRAHAGLGLGLALVRHLVELHGGVVEAESAGPGKGATFRVVLPAAGSGHAAAEPAQSG